MGRAVVGHVEDPVADDSAPDNRHQTRRHQQARDELEHRSAASAHRLVTPTDPVVASRRIHWAASRGSAWEVSATSAASIAGTSTLLKGEGRVNLTLRRVTLAGAGQADSP